MKGKVRTDTPAIRQRKAALLTGYGELWMRREGADIVLRIRHPFTDQWIDVMRHHHKEPMDDTVYPLGIEEIMMRCSPLSDPPQSQRASAKRSQGVPQ